MVRIVPAGTAGVARCAPIGTQLATNRPAAQLGTQPPRNTDPPVAYEEPATPAQQVAQHSRNSSATTIPLIGVQELRVAEPDSGAQLLDTAAREPPADPDVHQRWLVAIPGRPPFGVIVPQGATLSEMEGRYPTARSIMAEPPPDYFPATAAEAQELRRLIDIVLAGSPAAERDEVLKVALDDVQDALTSFRALVADREV